MPFPKRRTAKEKRLARQAANSKYYQKNRVAITAYRREKYQETRAEATKEASLERRREKAPTQTQTLNTMTSRYTIGSTGSSLPSIEGTATSSSPPSTHLQVALNQARNVYRQFRSVFRRQSRREFFITLHDRYDDSVEERENMNVLVKKLTNLVKRMDLCSSQVKMYAGKERDPIFEVDGYVLAMASWTEAMNEFDYWASWGKESLTEELHGREGKIHHLISYI